MAKIGSIKLQTGSGEVEIPVYDPGDVEYPVLRVETGSGTGAINLVDPGDADIDQIRVETSNGIKAVSTSTFDYLYADSWEDGKIRNRDSFSSTSHPYLNSGNIRDSRSSFDGGEPGKWSTTSSPDYSGSYSLQGDTNNTWICSTDNTYSPPYRARMRYRINDIWQKGLFYICVQQETSYSNRTGYYFGQGSESIRWGSTKSGGFDSTGEIFNTNEWYLFEFTHRENGDLSMVCKRSNGNEVVNWSTNNTDFSEGGIGFSRTGAGSSGDQVYYDNIEIERI